MNSKGRQYFEFKKTLPFQDYCDGGTLEEKIKEATIKKEFIAEKIVIQVNMSK